MDKVEFTDWYWVHQMFGGQEIFKEYGVGGGGDNSVNHVNHPWPKFLFLTGQGVLPFGGRCL